MGVIPKAGRLLCKQKDWVRFPHAPQMFKIECEKCKNLVTKNNLQRHINSCNGLGTKRNRPKKGRGTNIWNKGLTKETNDKVKKNSEAISLAIKGKPTLPHSEKTKKKLSEIAKLNKLGGHTSKKRVKYKNIVLHSSYEQKVAEQLDQNNIRWNRPNPLKWIDVNGIEHRYYPDFYLLDYNIYLDPKNDYLINKDQDKIKRVSEQNQVKVIVLDKNNLTWEKINAWVR